MILIVEQVYIFLYAILAGAIAAFLYDILRIKRRAIKTSVILVNLEDFLFWLVAAVILFLTVYKSNSGQMRGFIFIGNVIGVILYESLLSNIIIKSSIMIINVIKRILKFIWKVVSYPFKLVFKIILIPVSFLLKLITKLFKLIGKGLKNIVILADIKGKTKKLQSNAKNLGLKTGKAARSKMKKIRLKRNGKEPKSDNSKAS